MHPGLFGETTVRRLREADGRELYCEEREASSHNYLTIYEGLMPPTRTRKAHPEAEAMTSTINSIFPAIIVKAAAFVGFQMVYFICFCCF
jgi:hypothetical protein